MANGTMKHDNTCPSGYVSTGLSGLNITLVTGGYAIIGNLVLINMRVQMTGDAGSISGFPKPLLGAGYVAVTGYDASNEKAFFGYIDGDGVLRVPTAYTPDTGYIYLFTMYIKK